MKSTDQLNLYSGDTLVASFYKSHLTKVHNKDLLPLYFKHYTFLDDWLKSRSIDSHRPSSRLLKKALRLKEHDDVSIVLSQYARTLNDNYWIKPESSTISYSDLQFVFNKDISHLALYNDYDSFNEVAISNKNFTFELTNTGSFEKCWVKSDNEWYMLKRATDYEAFSEVFCYHLAKYFEFPSAVYFINSNNTVLSKNFAPDINYETMFNIVLDDDDYDLNISKLIELENIYNVELVEDFIRIIFLDTLVGNPDRHTKNYGVLRNQTTGEIISMAPNYDNNLSLISRGFPNNTTRDKDLLITLFLGVRDDYYERFSNIYIKTLNEEILDKIISEVSLEVTISLDNKSKEIIKQFILSAYNRIVDLDSLNKTSHFV